MSATIGLECDACGKYTIQELILDLPIACGNCDEAVGVVPMNWDVEKGCPACDCRHLYRRKDFNQILGLIIILAGAILGVTVSYFFLGLFFLLDLALYRWVNDLVVCYRCGAELRKVTLSGLNPFDHHTAELYDYGGDG